VDGCSGRVGDRQRLRAASRNCLARCLRRRLSSSPLQLVNVGGLRE